MGLSWFYGLHNVADHTTKHMLRFANFVAWWDPLGWSGGTRPSSPAPIGGGASPCLSLLLLPFAAASPPH